MLTRNMPLIYNDNDNAQFQKITKEEKGKTRRLRSRNVRQKIPLGVLPSIQDSLDENK